MGITHCVMVFIIVYRVWGIDNLLNMCKALGSSTITAKLKIKYVNKNLWKEAVSSETDWLISTVVPWKGWNAAGP